MITMCNNMVPQRVWTRIKAFYTPTVRTFASTTINKSKYSCRVLVVGGGSGGCTMAAKFTKTLGKGNVIVVEPSCDHYYQSFFTLIGGGMKKLSDSVQPMKKVLPKGACWLYDEVENFEPKENRVCTKNGDQIEYEFMIVSLGINMDYNKIPGLQEGLDDPCGGVCTIYSHKYVERVFEEFKSFEGGNAIFTCPNTPVKCAGAPQKIAYLFEDYLRRKCRRNGVTVVYNTSLPVLFSCKYYADALWKVVNKRDICVNVKRNLIEIKANEKIAIFEDTENKTKHESKYSLLHITPPQSPPKCLRECKAEGFVDSSGYLDVCENSLRHKKYENVYGIGDCTNAPTSKTAAAVAVQSGVAFKQIIAKMCGKPVGETYDGYTACPLITSYETGILAEFNYAKEPTETFPFKQNKEIPVFYHLNMLVFPYLYWERMLTGNWEGPKTLQKLFHPMGIKNKLKKE